MYKLFFKYLLNCLHLPFLQIVWQNRFHNNNRNCAKVTVDGTDFAAREQTPFSPAWWSFKLNRASVRYEIAISITTGWIVWINGPYPAGLYSDSCIAVECGLLNNLQHGKKVIVDSGYHGHNDIFI